MNSPIDPKAIEAFALDPSNHDAFAVVLEKVLPAYTRYGWGQPAVYKRFFQRWQRAGFTLYPNHYYSPVPDVAGISDARITAERSMEGFDFDSDAMTALAELFRRHFESEYRVFSDSASEADGGFFFGNGVFEHIDAEVLHCMIRHHRPRRVIEVGSGYSSLITAAACEINKSEGHPVEFTLVEPYPSDLFLRSIPGITRLIRKGVEECPLELFETLEAGDILFIDSSHVIRAGNDVEYEYFEIIPRLRPGVMIHIHDIFIPFRYPANWIQQECIFWNEQYLVEAMLMHNRSFKTLWAGSFMHQRFPNVLKAAFPGYNPQNSLPGSIWIYRSDNP